MDKPYASTNNPNIEILNQDIKEDKYGLVGEVVFRMLHNLKLFRVSSIHLDQNRLLKNVGIEIKKGTLVMSIPSNHKPIHYQRIDSIKLGYKLSK